MYKLLLCLRYLRTRYLALACIISVMLGVATLIVVNSVMSGFSTKLKERLHALLSDMDIEYPNGNGIKNPEAVIKRIHESPVGKDILAMTPTVECIAMMQFRCQNGEMYTMPRPIRLIGVDPVSKAGAGGFAEYLKRQKDSPAPSFELPPEVWPRLDPSTLVPQSKPEHAWPGQAAGHDEAQELQGPGQKVPEPDPPPTKYQTPHGIILGWALATYRAKDPVTKKPVDKIILPIGATVVITTVGGGQKLTPVYDRFVVCDYFKSEMSEYDSHYAFVPIDHLQLLRSMQGHATSIQIKLKSKDPAVAKRIQDHLRDMFPEYQIDRWDEKQGTLLAAIDIEKGILNVLLFMIICVAGFGILAIFAMIVVEKTRDIGVLKALGASNRGIMSIFLGYGLLLGVVGAGFGTLLGISIAHYINEIEHGITWLTGQEIFDKSIYYFNQIPVDIQPLSVLLVNVGAIAIAVVFSILPAIKAAMLQPVRALRYE